MQKNTGWACIYHYLTFVFLHYYFFSDDKGVVPLGSGIVLVHFIRPVK